VIDLMF